MKRKAICAGIALLLAGCLLASCGKDGETESSSEAVTTEVVSSAETSAESSFGATSSEESSAESSFVTSSEESSTEVTSSEPTSEEPTPEPFVPTPMPEGLPGIDSPAPPKETGYYLPAKGWSETHLVDRFPLTYTFTYGENTMVIEETGHEGTYIRVEYRFDGHARPVEVITDTRKSQWGGSLTRTKYTYDEEGRMTGWIRTAESEEDTETERHNYFYGEDSRLTQEDIAYIESDGTTKTYTNRYERGYDETGNLLWMEETDLWGYPIRHRYEDGREVLRQIYYGDGTLYAASTFDYDENGRLIGERCRTGADVYTDVYYYEEDRLIEIRRDEGKGATPYLWRRYDAYGRLTAAIVKEHYGYYEVYSYAKNGCLSEVACYYPGEDGEFGRVLDLAVTAWGDKAVTDMQMAFYRVAMDRLLGGWDGQGAQFSDVELPEP